MIRTTALFTACLLAVASVGTAQTAAPTTTPGNTAPTPTTAPSPAAAAAPLAVEDLEGLRTHLNETVDVRGTPATTGHSKTGTVTYLNFGPAHKALAVVAFLSAGAGGDAAAHKVQSEDDLKAFVGKAVIVHGKVADYKGDLQIVLDSLDQIKLAP